MNAKWIGQTLLAIAAMALPAAAAEEVEGVALTVYNGDFGVVREVRAVDINAGGEVRFVDVAAGIDPTSVHFRSLTDPAAKLLEQNYQYDLVSADKLLSKYLDKRIEVVAADGRYSGELLSYDAQQLVLRRQGGLTMVQRPDNVRDIQFGALPEGLITRPTLLWLIDTETPGKHLVEVTYQTGRINWHAEYNLILSADNATADLAGWVSVDNRSGKTYRNARCKFIAGDVRREAPRMRERRFAAGVALAKAAPMAEKAFFEYHMYTLGRRTTVADNETKQLEMFSPARGVKIARKYLFNPLERIAWRGGRYTDPGYGVDPAAKKVGVVIELVNSEANQLGIPLPAGKVRVYKADPDDEALEFVGEQRIDHTPKDEKLKLRVGNAFDIVGERKQTKYTIDSRRNWLRESIEIKLRNHKSDNVTVRVKEPLYRAKGWRITTQSHEHVELDAHTLGWDLPVAADGETVLTYTVEYNW